MKYKKAFTARKLLPSSNLSKNEWVAQFLVMSFRDEEAKKLIYSRL
jgi:hypothetical protein